VLVRKLANLAFGNGRHGTLMTISAYFDGSGKQDDHSVVTVGGYVADDIVCGQIEDEWLRATGGKVFHLTDFGTNKCELGSGMWGEDARSDFLCRLGRIVNRPEVAIVSQSIDVAKYQEFSATSQFSDIGGPVYSCAATMCIYAAETILLGRALLLEQLAYVFEKGEREHELRHTLDDIEKRFPEKRDIRSHHFLPKCTTLLQPADLISGIAQELLLSVKADHKSISDGRTFKSLSRFWKFYRTDGVTESVLPRKQQYFRAVVNRPTLEHLDQITERSVEKYPDILKKRRKAKINQGRKTPKRSHEEVQSRIREFQQRNGYDPSRRSESRERGDGSGEESER